MNLFCMLMRAPRLILLACDVVGQGALLRILLAHIRHGGDGLLEEVKEFC